MKNAIQNNMMIVELPAAMENEIVDNIMVESKIWLLSPVDLFSLDFKNVRILKPACYRVLVLFAHQVRNAKKKIVSFNLTEEISRQVKMDGISTSLNVVDDYQNYLSREFPVKVGGSALDVNLINPFLYAAKKTLEMQANVACEILKPRLSHVNDKIQDLPIAIAGVMNISTESFNGSIALAFPEEVFLRIYESLSGENHVKINDEIKDAAGELLNIIFGSAKTVLNEEFGFTLSPTLPTVLSGDKIKIRQHSKQQVIVLPFKTKFGDFHVEISFDFFQK